MRALVVEDDFTCRKLMTALLGPHFDCDVAVDGEEAVEAFGNAIEGDQPYDLVCLDIMMPKMDGQEALRRIRQMESERGINGLDGVKIIMTTAVDEPSSIMTAFREQCESYLVKPIDSENLLGEIRRLGLIIDTDQAAAT